MKLDIDTEITKDNLEDYALNFYENPHCLNMKEFKSDLKRVTHVRRHIRDFLDKDIERARLILNHLIILHNTFGEYPTAKMLFYKCEKRMYPVLKTYLIYLKKMPKMIDGKHESEIPLVSKTINILRNLN